MLFEKAAEYYEKLEGLSSRLAMIDLLSEMLKEAEKDEIRHLIYLTQGVLGPPFEGIQIGIAEKFAEEAIAMATGYEKEEVRSLYRKKGDMGEVAEELREKGRLKRMSQEKQNINELFNEMKKIASTSGTGSQELKIKMLAHMISASSGRGAKYITRLALGTLRLGLGDATILEALSKMATGERKLKDELENAYNICSDLGKVGEVLAKNGVKGIEEFKVEIFNPIRPALAERLPTSEEILDKMGGRCAVESKYDGMRAQVHIDREKKRVEIFSRNLERITDMFPEIAKAVLTDLNAKSAIIEGEAIAYDEISDEFFPFQETIQRKRKHGIKEKSEEIPLHLFAFDLMYLNGEDYLEKSFSDRREELGKIVTSNRIRLTDMIIAKSPKELDSYFNNAVGEGLEGIMAKDLSSRYIAGARKFSWIKMKRSYKGQLSDTLDLVIIGYFLGRGSRAEFGFGGLLSAVYNKKRDMFESVTKIGTGFTEEQMKFFKEKLHKITLQKKPARVDSDIIPDFWTEPIYVVAVRADEITRSPTHICGKREDKEELGYALRFPRLVSDGIREDKSAEDATTTKEVIEMFEQQKKTKVKD